MLKVGLIGVGGISGAHIRCWEDIKEVELVALCDVRPDRMELYPDKRHYTDFDSMLENEELDILDICLPSYLHADYSIKAMKKGINVICEKPVSLKKEDVARVYATAEKNNVKFMIAHVLRFWPEYEYVKKIFDSGKYGKLLTGSMQRLNRIPQTSWDGWMFDEKRSGLVPFDLHIHDVDFMVYAFGVPKKVNSLRNRRPEQDYLNAMYDYGDYFVTVEAAWYAQPYPFKMSYRFQFEKALLAFENDVLTVYENSGEISTPLSHTENYESDTSYVPAGDGYKKEIVYFTECVLQDKKCDFIKPEELEAVVGILNNI